MAPRQEKRSVRVLPALTVGAGVGLVALRPCFLTAPKANEEAAARGRTAMRGFKEDFESWRSSLTPEEQELVQTQAVGEFNKKFRKSDEFKKDLPEEKVKSFSNILGKFFDAESADYKKEADAKVPNYNRLLEKAGDKVLNFKMKSRIVPIDRDADRRYNFAMRMAEKNREMGKAMPPSTRETVDVLLKNDDAASHAKLKELLKDVDVPAMGQEFEFAFPAQLKEQLDSVRAYLQAKVDAGEASSEDAKEVFLKATVHFSKVYKSTLEQIDADVVASKEFFSAVPDAGKYKTKADVLRALRAELKDSPLAEIEEKLPPFDEEQLAEFEEMPVVQEDGFKNTWGSAETLYKSEAIDAFGMRYLLGVFDTEAEAQKAFDEWNAEYVKARADMQSEMEQWSKQENARLEADTSGADRIKKILEEARR